ncbi:MULTISPECIES: zinc metalloprotease [Actinomadura]|uniref:Zinc metalloprotease n=1 Tax=Actinomadura yumaensis TaxID=111807 RepID=A0ABW2CR75_9ACTN|nr:zinc metalloprotease [Actinomadura sp. J1-007]
MKLLAAAALIAASAPAVPAATPVAPAAPARTVHLAGPGGCASPGAPAVPGVPAVPASGHGRAGADARVRDPDSGARERNELTPAQAATVERDLADVLAGLGIGRRAGEHRSPEAEEQVRRAQVRIPVYFHVLHDGARGNVSNALIDRQITVLNDTYGGRKGGADTGFSFELKKVTRSDDAAWYSDPERHEAAFKPKLRQGGAGALNLYSADLGKDLLGWSTFPWKYKGDPKKDGVVVHAGSMPGGSIEHFNLGYSAAHETGHWLGLYHTFQDGCGGAGDRVADTPDERDPTNGCPTGKDTCPSAGDDPVHNFMDYAWDSCMHEFTKGQGERLHKVWAAYRR